MVDFWKITLEYLLLRGDGSIKIDKYSHIVTESNVNASQHVRKQSVYIIDADGNRFLYTDRFLHRITAVKVSPDVN